MNRQLSEGGRGRKDRFLPCVEPLEDRSLLAVNFFVFNTTLVVVAPTVHTPVNTNIRIIDNGTTNPNDVVAFAGPFVFFPAVYINTVILLPGPGNDNIIYNMTGPLNGNRLVFTNLSSGTDTFAATLAGEAAGANLTMTTLGAPLKGGDSILGLVNGNLQANANLTWNAFTVLGNSNLGFSMAGSIAAGAGLGVNQFGATGTNQVRTTYIGQMNGLMSMFENGGPKNDNLFADLEFVSGSTGTLMPGAMLGQGGNNVLTYIVHNPSHSAIIYNQILDGGPGRHNVANRTTNVLAFDIAVDNLLP
jgi:hypothetical protein